MLTDDISYGLTALTDFISSVINRSTKGGYSTSSVYTSAWVSLVRKGNIATGELAFPECFHYVLDSQLPSGTWPCYHSDADGIVDGLAGLLSLMRNADVAVTKLGNNDYQIRVSNATQSLQDMLDAFTFDGCDHAGFELIVPSLLEALEKDGITFSFPSKTLLLQTAQIKLSNIPSIAWSGKFRTTVLHCLEAFVGKADFSNLSNLLIEGMIGDTPASTAAFLMHKWDDTVANSLRELVDSTVSPEVGGLPISFPSTGWEVFWVAGTLLQNGIGVKDTPEIEKVLQVIDEFYQHNHGLAGGFSASSLVDADDTAMAIIIRNLLLIPTDCKQLIHRFDGERHFKTYDYERTYSISTNCHVLSALLYSPNPLEYVPQIQKIAELLCGVWMKNIILRDKWNISDQYSFMCISESLVHLLHALDQKLFILPSETTKEMTLVLSQVLHRILSTQNNDQSWGESIPEVTSYAIISLANLASLPCLTRTVQNKIASAIQGGRSFLSAVPNEPKQHRLWIDKTSFSPIHVSNAFCIAANVVSYPKRLFRPVNAWSTPWGSVEQWTLTVSKAAPLEKVPKWSLHLSCMEALLFSTVMETGQQQFPMTRTKWDDHLEFLIAFLTSCANALSGFLLITDAVIELAKAIHLIYKFDDFIELFIRQRLIDDMEKVPPLMDKYFCELDTINTWVPDMVGLQNGQQTGPDVKIQGKDGGAIEEFLIQTQKFVTAMGHNEHAKKATLRDLNVLKHHLRCFIRAQAQQVVDSESHYGASKSIWSKGPSAFVAHRWIRGAGVEHAGTPFITAYLRCMLNRPASYTPSAQQQYLCQDIAYRIGSWTRIDNDLVSLRRDRQEKNLNVLDFDEFVGLKDEIASEQILAIVAYEKECCQVAFRKLEKLEGNMSGYTDLAVLKFIETISVVFGEVYRIKDLSKKD